MSAFCLVLLTTCLADPPKPSSSSDAERIARLQRSVEEGEKQLAAIKKQLDDPNSEYVRAQADFKTVNESREKVKRDLEKLRKEKKTAEAEPLAGDLVKLEKSWQRARDRFDNAIEERKALQAKAASLPGKIEPERRALERLLGNSPTKKEPEKKPVEKKEQPAESPKKKEDKPATPEKKPEEAVKSAKTDRQLDQARELARLKDEAAEQARDKVNSVNDYIEQLKRQIELEERLLVTARKKLAFARDAQSDLEEDQRKRVESQVPPAEIEKGWQDINRAVQRVDEVTADERDITDRLSELQAQLARAQAFQITAMQAAESSSQEASSARKSLDELQNPFHPHNIQQWLREHGGQLVAIFLGMTALYILVRTGTRRLIRVMTQVGLEQLGRGSEDRAETLISVFRNTLSVFIIVGGVLMLLDEVGIPIVPLMGGAAVLGLAVAFGAQNLIKDYFTGFMILMEDQYAVHDAVRINNYDGQVERITLRMTVLRDLAGVAHFIPHGTINSVSNMSHGWAKANLEIGIGYKENPDYVLGVLRDICAELRGDDAFAPLILEDAEMLGVEQLGDSAVVLKFVIKTKPMKQWDVKRELLRRIKCRFEQLGIEIPYPHRTILHHRQDSASDFVRLVA